MFKSATIKLTVFYVLAISAVCLVFSVSVYGFASSGIDRQAKRQANIFQEFNTNSTIQPRPLRPGDPQPPQPSLEVRQQIRKQIEIDRERLLRNILIVDVLIIGFGAIASFYFARRILNPIGKTMEKQKRFSADASHELRTPLAVMKAEIDVALQQKLKSAQLEEVLESNLEEIERLCNLADQLLALTSVEEDKLKIENIDFSTQVKDVIDKFESKQKIEIEKDIDPKISVNGYSSLLDNCVQTLLENAVKYSKEDSLRIMVSLKKSKNNVCVLTVRDEGIGIELEDMDKVFDRFYRSNSAKKSGRSGHGLGLSVASEIAKKHGSRILVNSVPDKFSEFSLSLKCS